MKGKMLGNIQRLRRREGEGEEKSERGNLRKYWSIDG